MGQYYRWYVKDSKGNEETAISYDYDNGAKLMEHSYIGNHYVNACLDEIYYNPCQVAWVGDYSEDGNCVYNNKAENFNETYLKVWGENCVKTAEFLADNELIKFNVNYCNYFLINHTKKIFIDVAKYVDSCKWHEEGDRHNYMTNEDEHYSFDMCINPLPLLTACGNGQGGGDYRGSNWMPTDDTEVGSWALDIIELTDEKPNDYEEVEYFFKEDM